MVQLGDREIHTNEGTEIGAIFRKAGLKDKSIVAATLNQGLVSLHTQIQGPCTIDPITTDHPIGRTVRRRTVSHMLQTMVSGRGDGLQLVIGQSIAGGYYYEVTNPGDTDLKTLAEQLTGGIHHLAKAGIGFSYATVSVDGARRLLTDPSGSKAALLETWPSPMLVVVRLGQFVDIPHGPYAPDTSYGEGATVIPFQDGLLLDFGDNGSMPPPERSQKLFACYRRTAEWNRNLNVDTIGKLNQTILKEQEEDIIRIAEALHEKRIANIADEIANRPQTHIVCIAGPSSSGKTTFMRRLSDQLRVNGMKPHLLSLDDYYRDREKCPIDPINGRFDFESPEALDIPLLHQHFDQIIKGKSFELPHFDF
jgi:uridine kinase